MFKDRPSERKMDVKQLITYVLDVVYLSGDKGVSKASLQDKLLFTNLGNHGIIDTALQLLVKTGEIFEMRPGIFRTTRLVKPERRIVSADDSDYRKDELEEAKKKIRESPATTANVLRLVMKLEIELVDKLNTLKERMDKAIDSIDIRVRNLEEDKKIAEVFNEAKEETKP